MATKISTNPLVYISQRQAAVVAGLAIVALVILAGFAYGFVFQSLVVPGDATATAKNIKNNETLFRISIFCWLLNFIVDVLVAWVLYIFLKPVNESLSLLTAWLRLVYSAIFGAALLNFSIVLLLIGNADYLSVFEKDQIDALALLFLNAFDDIFSIGLVVFGFHLLSLGYLVFKSGFIPKILGILLLLASLGYLITSSANLLLSNYEDYKAITEMILVPPMILGELVFGLWLLIRGGDPELRN